MLRRRGFLLGLLAAPAIIRTPGLLMQVRARFRVLNSAELALTIEEFSERYLKPAADQLLLTPNLISREILAILANSITKNQDWPLADEIGTRLAIRKTVLWEGTEIT